MGHINYDFKLGQIIAKPNETGEFYNDSFIDAYTLRSWKDLQEGQGGDVTKYSYFTEMYGAQGGEGAVVRHLIFPRTYILDDPNNWSSFVDNVTLKNGISLATFADRGAGSDSPKWSYEMGAGVFFEIDLTNSTSGHVHSYVGAQFAIDFEIVLVSSVEGFETPNGWVTLPSLWSSNTSQTTPTLPKVIEYEYKGIVYFPEDDLPDYITGYPNTEGYFALLGGKLLVDRTTGNPTASPFVYNPVEEKDTEMFGSAYYQAALGTNMFLIVSVNRNIFEEFDLAYVRGQVGKTFMGVLPISFYEGSVSLDIAPVHISRILAKVDYPEFFEIYGISEDTFDVRNLLTVGPLPRNLKFYNAQDRSQVGEYRPKEFPEELVNTIDTYLPHQSRFFTRLPPTIKAATGLGTGYTYLATLITSASMKDTLPSRVMNEPSSPAGKDMVSFGGKNTTTDDTGFTLNHVTYVVLKSKI